MNGNGREKARVGGAGQVRDEAGANPLSLPIVMHPVEFVNPQFSALPSSIGGICNWCITDALATLSRELIERGLVEDNDELTEAIGASWARMVNEASYIPAAELAEIERALEVSQ